MDEIVKIWLLYKIKHASHGYLSINELSKDLPNVIENVNALSIYISELQRKKYIVLDKNHLSSYLITKEGNIELKKILNNAGNFKYLRIISLIPDLEVRYRISMIEQFLASLILGILLTTFVYIFRETIGKSRLFSYTFIVIIFLIFSICFGSATALIINFIYYFTRRTFTRISEYIDEHWDMIFKIFKVAFILIVIVLFIGMLYLVSNFVIPKLFPKYTPQDVYFNIIIAILVVFIIYIFNKRKTILIWINKQSSEIRKWIDKKISKIKIR
jgi:hypothetical protein